MTTTSFVSRRAVRTSHRAPAEEAMPIHRGSGDFVKDQGISDPDEFRVKAHLCHEIAKRTAGRALSQSDAAVMMDMAQADVSRIVNSRFEDYSVWRLMKALAKLGSDVVITVHPEGDEPGIIAARILELEPDEGLSPTL